MGLARIYVLLAAVCAVILVHSLCTRGTGHREGYSLQEGRQRANKTLSDDNTEDIKKLQAQVQRLEQIRDRITAISTGISGHKTLMKNITKQTTEIGSGKQIQQSGLTASKSQSASLRDKYK